MMVEIRDRHGFRIDNAAGLATGSSLSEGVHPHSGCSRTRSGQSPTNHKTNLIQKGHPMSLKPNLVGKPCFNRFQRALELGSDQVLYPVKPTARRKKANQMCEK